MQALIVYALCIALIAFWGKICTIMQISVHKTLNNNYLTTEYPVAGWIAVQVIFVWIICLYTLAMELLCLIILHLYNGALLRVDTNTGISLLMDAIAPAAIYLCAISPVAKFAIESVRTLKLVDNKSVRVMRRLHIISMLIYTILIAYMYSEFANTSVLEAIRDISIKR